MPVSNEILGYVQALVAKGRSSSKIWGMLIGAISPEELTEVFQSLKLEVPVNQSNPDKFGGVVSLQSGEEKTLTIPTAPPADPSIHLWIGAGIIVLVALLLIFLIFK